MVKLISLPDSKQLKKLTKNKDFIFSVICYPVALFVFLIIQMYLKDFDFDKDTAFWYTLLTFGFFAFIVFISIYERMEKKVSHKIQGDMLKVKQEEKKWREH